MKITIRNLEIEISPEELKYLQIDHQIDQMANEIKRENLETEQEIKKIDKEIKETEEYIKNNRIGF